MSVARKTALLLALCAAPLVPAALAAQTTAPAPPPTRGAAASPAEAEARAWLQELQQISAKVQAAQAQALSDPVLKARHEALGEQIEAAVSKADPSLAGLATRVKALDEQMRAAQQKGDRDAFEKLVGQGRELEQRFVRARQIALKDSALASRTEAFGATLQKKMMEIEPTLPKLLARGQELQTKLQAAVRSQQPPAR